jgi:fatty acid synthase
MQAIIVARAGSHIPCWVTQPPLCRILAVMTNNDGYTKEGITFPSGQAQAELSAQVPVFCFKCIIFLLRS